MARTKKPEGAAALDAVLADIQKKRGVTVGTVTETVRPIEVLSTGNLAIDYVTGVGGFPKGRIIELFGLPSSGKSTAALHAVAEARKQGLYATYFDFERATDPAYVSAFGIDPDDPGFFFSTPDTLEEGMNSMRDLIATGQIAIGVVDSVAAMVSQKELEAETGQNMALGLKPKAMAQAMRQMTGLANKYGTILIFVNHAQEVIDTSAMGQRLAGAGVERWNTPGGNALKFHATLRLHFKIIGKQKRDVEGVLSDKDEKQAFANNVRVIVEKNKVAPPFRQAELRLEYGKGFSQSFTVLQVLATHGFVKKKPGGHYEIPSPEGEIESYRGEPAALDRISADLDAYAAIAMDKLEEATREPTAEELAEIVERQAREDAAAAEAIAALDA